MKSFYNVYGKQQTLSVKSENNKNTLIKKLDFRLSWSHYLILMRIDNLDERKFYELEAVENKMNKQQTTNVCKK